MQAAPLSILSEALGWLIPISWLGCTVICLLFLRVSKSLLIAAAGFGLMGVSGFVWRAFYFFQRTQVVRLPFQDAMQFVALFQICASLLGVAGVMLGLFLGLSEAHRKLSAPGDSPWIT